ncbi:MAG: hypothetical protein WBA29_11395 [Xanthobacteraceae bacterium]
MTVNADSPAVTPTLEKQGFQYALTLPGGVARKGEAGATVPHRAGLMS